MQNNGDDLCVHDAVGKAFDPTGTGFIRRAWRTDARVRAKQVENRLHTIIDLTDGMASEPTILAITNRYLATDRWWARFVVAAYRKGMQAGSHRLGLPEPMLNASGFGDLDHLTRRTSAEIALIAKDLGNELSLGVGTAIDATAAKRFVTSRVSAIGEYRMNLVAEVECVSSCAYGTLRVYKDNNVTKITIIPEGLATTDARHARRGPGGRFASTEASLAEWETAGDQKVCPACEELEGKVFDLDESEDLIPLHPNCRCAWAPLE